MVSPFSLGVIVTDYKAVIVDFDYVSGQGTDKKLHALSDQEMQALLTISQTLHWSSRWSLLEPTTGELDLIDAIASGAERGLLQEVSGADDLSPFWDDNDAADADGTVIESTYTFEEQIEDWVITAFVAASGQPGAALTYLTIAPRFRLAFRTRDFGGIARILIDDVLFTEIDTYSATPGLAFLDVIIP